MDPRLIVDYAREIFPRIRGWRHHLHQWPELSFQEEKTSLYLQGVLREELGLAYTSNWGGFGIVGILEGGIRDRRVVALRADMDALPIQESKDIPYKSRVPGCMHACGHDVHMACLLGALAILQRFKSHWGGRVKFIFQPGEEQLPGGASKLIAQGVLENPRPDLVLGLHVSPGLSVGQVGICPGPAMASSDELYIAIEGQGGHAAQPHLTKDPVYAAALYIVHAQNLISRLKPPMVPSVLSFGKISSDGGATNIIPDRVLIEATFRSLDGEWRKAAHEHVANLAEGISKSLGLNIRVNTVEGYPVLHNNETLSTAFKCLINNTLGENSCVVIPPRLTSEDFAHYSCILPALFYRLGVGDGPGVHRSDFDIDEEAMVTGAASLALGAMYLNYT